MLKIDHISFVTAHFQKYNNILSAEIITRFDVEKTHGVKIAIGDIIIEIRNNDIVESCRDFTKKVTS